MIRAGRSDLKPSKGFHFAAGAYVEYIGNVEANQRDALVATLNEKCADLITNTPAENNVFKKVCEYDEASQLLAGCGGVPDYVPAGSSLRVLKLVPEDLGCPCGGTHVEHIADIKQI